MDITFIKIQHPWQYDLFSEPPLGFLSVAAVARQIPGVKVSLSDMAIDYRLGDYRSLAHSLPESDIYALTAHTLEFSGIVDCAKELKKVNLKSSIIAGGVHFDVFNKQYWEEQISTLPFDIISIGEGEANIGRIIDFVKSGKRKVVVNQLGNFLDLNSLPFPARDLLNQKRYFPSSKDNNLKNEYSAGNSTTLMVSRGCPYSCKFCASPGLHNRTIRFRSRSLVEEEIRLLRDEYGKTSLRWHDDNFPLNLWSKQQKGLENFLHESGVFSRGSARTSDICKKPTVLDTLWYAGFRELGIGVESIEDSVLKLMDKKTTVQQHKQALKMIKDKGFITRIFLISGLPGETKDTGKRTLDFLEETQPDVVTLMIFDPYPGSDTFNHPEKYGISGISGDWERHNIAISREPTTPLSFPYTLDSIASKEMVVNLEIIKEWVFTNNRSNVPVYNKPYKAEII